MIKLLNKLAGTYRFSVECDRPTKIINLLHSRGISPFLSENPGDGRFVFDVMKKDFELVREILDKNGLRGYSVYRTGLPGRIAKYKKRAGMPVGMLIFAALLYASTLFVWNIEVVEPGSVDSREILDNLQKVGFGVGTYLPGCDLEDVCFRYVSSFDDVSWIAVNVKGTVAGVEVRDVIRARGEDDDTPSNIVASEDALIESFSVYGGLSQVEPGQVVRKGELLISGVVDDKQGVLHLCRASGEVLGRVALELTASADRTERTAYTEPAPFTEKELDLFGKRITLSRHTEDEKKEYPEKTSERSSLVLFDAIELPLTLETVRYGRVREKTVRHTDDETRIIAEQKLAAMIDELNADIISLEINESDDGETITLTCRVECIKNIAEERKIGVSENENE